MPFGLKKIGAIYQKAITTIFHNYMHIFMEDYVDDLLAKSLSRDSHLIVLDNIFKSLEEYKFILNPKNVFRVQAYKLLLYIISHRGIEASLLKVKAIMDMPPLKNIGQLHTLEG